MNKSVSNSINFAPQWRVLKETTRSRCFAISIFMPLTLLLIQACSSTETIHEKVKAKGIYYPTNLVEKNAVSAIEMTEKTGMSLSQSSTEKKSIPVNQLLTDMATGERRDIDLGITLRAHVILAENSGKSKKKDASPIVGYCFTLTHLSTDSSIAGNLYLYGRKLDGLFELNSQTEILNFQSKIPQKYATTLERAVGWCWSYVYYLNDTKILSGYSAIFESLAINMPIQSCTPYPSAPSRPHDQCKSWFATLPDKFKRGTVPVCSPLKTKSSTGQCEVRGNVGTKCPVLITSKNVKITSSDEVNQLIHYTEPDLTGSPAYLCQDLHLECSAVTGKRFTRFGKEDYTDHMCQSSH